MHNQYNGYFELQNCMNIVDYKQTTNGAKLLA